MDHDGNEKRATKDEQELNLLKIQADNNGGGGGPNYFVFDDVFLKFPRSLKKWKGDYNATRQP